MFKKRSRSALRDGGSPFDKKREDWDDESSPKKKSKKLLDDETREATLSLQDDLSFNSLLHQDITVGGLRFKTEDIIDANSVASPLVNLSPPPSEENSDDFDDLLGADLSEMSNDIDSSDGMDLAIQGIKIEPPEWWSDSLTGNTLKSLFGSMNGGVPLLPVQPAAHMAASPMHHLLGSDSHPWNTNKSDIDDAIAALDDVDKLFYNHNAPSPQP